MKKNVVRNLVVLLCFGLFISAGFSQNSPNVDDLFEDDKKFTQKLWYGGGVNLGFQSFNGISQFLFGLSPMVGYKITDEFSMGPRAAVQYTYYKINAETAQPLSWAIGAFSRYKLFPSIFAHIEYEFEDRALAAYDGFELSIFRQARNNFYAGGGYHSGNGLWGYELVVLYNFLEEDFNDIPFIIRAGITYKF